MCTDQECSLTAVLCTPHLTTSLHSHSTAACEQILTYQGELLFQGLHNKVVITLLQEEVEDSTIAKYTTANPKGMKRTDLPPDTKRKTTGFSAGTSFTGNTKVLGPLCSAYCM